MLRNLFHNSEQSSASFVLHIGLNKTGTSSLQHYLYNNRESLKKEGVLYPDLGVEDCAHYGISKFIKGASVDSLPSDWLDVLNKESCKFRKVILSSEDFRTIKDVASVARFFPKKSTKVIVYLREHYSFLSSWYQQAVHGNNLTCSFKDFVQLYRADFTEIVDKWQAVFGAQNVVVKEYNFDKFKNNDLISDFLDEAAGLEKIDSADKISRNPSLAGSLLELKRVLNHFISKEESYEIAFELNKLALSEESFRGSLATTEDLVAQVRWIYRQDRKNMNERFGMTFNEDRKRHAQIPLEQLHQDWKKIYAVAKDKNMKLVKFLDRIPQF